MGGLKTKQHEGDVMKFVRSFSNTEQKQLDSYQLIEIMTQTSGYPPKRWGESMIGFGVYHYKSERSTQEGDWPIVGFSPRKAAISLYVFTGREEHEYLLEGLGKYKRGKACIYINKLSDINVEKLEDLIRHTTEFIETRYGKKNND